MSKLLVKANKGHGRVAHVTPKNAGWTYVGFDLHRLKPGESASGKTDDREVCLVFITGKGTAKADGKELGLLGERMSPFEGKPWSVYLPEGSDWSVTADTDLELAVCSAPGLSGGLPVRVAGRPRRTGQLLCGFGSWDRSRSGRMRAGAASARRNGARCWPCSCSIRARWSPPTG